MIKHFASKQFFRFLLTGGLNTAFGYCAFAFFIFLTENPTTSVILSNVVGILFNFKTYGSFVFKSKDNSRIFRFFGAYAFLTLTQVYTLRAFAYFGVTNSYLAGAIITPPMAVLSFILLKKFVFHQKLVFGQEDPD